MKLRPFKITDAPTILSWTKNKTEFRKWSADRYPNYPMPHNPCAWVILVLAIPLLGINVIKKQQ